MLMIPRDLVISDVGEMPEFKLSDHEITKRVVS